MRVLPWHASSCPFWCRPVEIPQVKFLACFVMLVVVPTPVEIPQVQFSGKVVVPVFVHRQLRGSMVL